MRRASPALAALLGLLVAGCGWHLRGSSPGAQGLEGTAIGLRSSIDDPALERRVTRELEVYGARVVEPEDETAAVLELLGESLGQRISSVTAGADVRQYELTYSLRFRVRTADQPDAGEPQAVLVTRTYQADPDDPLVNQSRRERATDELRGEAVSQLAARVGAALR